MILLNPGPVNVSERVRQALLRPDICHRESEFSDMLLRIQQKLLTAFVPGAESDYVAVVLTGSGTAAVESAVMSCLPLGKRMLVLNNGVYGERLSNMIGLQRLGVSELKSDWHVRPDPERLRLALRQHPEVHAVSMVHHETTTGLINPVKDIAEVVDSLNRVFVLDSVSGLAGEAIDIAGSHIYMVAGTAGKCIQGFPGVSFVLLRKGFLERMRKYPKRSWYLTLTHYVDDQGRGIVPFTPAVQVYYAFEEALDELLEEGVANRLQRYKRAAVRIRERMAKLGVKTLLSADSLSNTITAFHLPAGLSYASLHDQLKARGYVIYAGQGQLESKVFRVANMGALTEAQIDGFLGAFEEVLSGATARRMKAIILAAGVGKRLWPVTQHRPKCLIEIGGQTLLSRYLESLASVRVTHATIVVGYKQEMIRAAVGSQCHGVDLSYLVNEEFHRGSISSLWIARQALTDDAVIMDADVLFHREILRRLVSSSYENCLLMDDTVKQTGEECMVVVQGDRVIALSKKMPDRYDLAGEGVGFLRVRRADAPHVIASLKGYVDQGRWDMEYEDGLLQYFRDVKVGHEKIGGLPWTEIDFPEDITKAERDVLPRL